MRELTETVDKAPSFRKAFAKRRCLIPADGFYEWRKTAKPKLPFAIAMKDGRPFTFAGLWEGWRDPESGEWLRTCTIITGEPNELVAQIHPRMPVILPPATSCSVVGPQSSWLRKHTVAYSTTS
jgi:putative SOS response-associated peptidase YedK